MKSLKDILDSSPEDKNPIKKRVDTKEDPVDKSRSKWDKVYWVDDIELLEDCSWDIEAYQKRDGVIIDTEPVELKKNRPAAIPVDDRESLIIEEASEIIGGDTDIIREEKIALKRLRSRKSMTTRQKALVVNAFANIKKILTLYGVGINNRIKTQDIPVVLETLTAVERRLWGVVE